LSRQADRALDVGCGAGLSTAALTPLARQVIGLEPISAMLTYRQAVAPRARFVLGQAERLPFPARSFDLVAAAGSLNYTDLPAALAEVSRVLTRDGTFLLYDFSTGQGAVSGGGFPHRREVGPGTGQQEPRNSLEWWPPLVIWVTSCGPGERWSRRSRPGLR
jgi:ubiquinone/menaquinone biosynthesis C-methylase UbiE